MMIKNEVNTEHILAQHLKSLRTDRGLSLENLAKRSGVSRATLSRIEKCEVSPTANVLGKLCTAFELTLSRLMIMVESKSPALIKREDQTEWTDIETGFKRRSVSPPDDNLVCEVLECELSAGAYINYDAPPTLNLEHHLVLLNGMLEMDIEGRKYLLSPGDCLRYKLQGSSTFKTIGNEVVKYILVIA